MTDDQKRLYNSIVHGLRSQGWSKIEAEIAAFDRVISTLKNPYPEDFLSSQPHKGE